MIIRCPSCHFERDVPSDSLRVGKVYKVTCPRCAGVFQFSLAEPEEETDTPVLPEGASLVENTSAEPEAAPPRREVPTEEAELRSAPHLPTEQEGDDPLPPGAAIPDLSRSAPQEKRAEPEEPAGEHQRTWDSWHEGTENPGRDQEPDPYAPRSDGRPAGAPWESPEYYGFWGSFLQTLIGVLFHARDFFQHVRSPFSVIRPILFYVLLSLFQMLAARLWSIKALQEISATTADPQKLAMAEQLMQSMNMPLMLLITPFFSIFQAVILAGLYHLMIRMVQPDRADFATTLRVVCYSAAPLVLCIVPMVGSIVASLWFVLATFLGCKFALNLSWTRTVLALLPLYILELAFVSQLPALMAV